MEQSNLVRSLRVTFLAVGFLAFVFMTAQWVQHLATTKPALPTRIIATIPTVDGLTGRAAANDVHVSSFASFVQTSSSGEFAGSNKYHTSEEAKVSTHAAKTKDSHVSASATSTTPVVAPVADQAKSVTKLPTVPNHKRELPHAAL